jgi:hypothetical protein
MLRFRFEQSTFICAFQRRYTEIAPEAPADVDANSTNAIATNDANAPISNDDDNGNNKAPVDDVQLPDS